VLYEIHGMGHTWPGRESRYRALGRVTQNVDANEVMWEFFTRHPRTE
jgi:polyhydroxybutyrate depolymerase